MLCVFKCEHCFIAGCRDYSAAAALEAGEANDASNSIVTADEVASSVSTQTTTTTTTAEQQQLAASSAVGTDSIVEALKAHKLFALWMRFQDSVLLDYVIKFNSESTAGNEDMKNTGPQALSSGSHVPDSFDEQGISFEEEDDDEDAFADFGNHHATRWEAFPVRSCRCCSCCFLGVLFD